MCFANSIWCWKSFVWLTDWFIFYRFILDLIVIKFSESNDIEMHLRVNIGAGNITTVHCGGKEGRWLFLVSGEIVNSTFALDHKNKPG